MPRRIQRSMLFIMMLFFSGFVQAATTTLVNTSPVVAITNPDNKSTVVAGSNIAITATASATDGTISSVSFYNGSTLLGQSSKSPYSYTWDDVPASTYTLTAVATDTHKVSTTSSPITVTVTSSSAPVIAITSPANGSTYTAGSNITITVSASESNGTIREVYFFDRAYYLGTSTVSPYTYTWTNVPAGTYSLTVEATDNKGGTLISAPINITVNPAPALPKTPSVKK